MNDKYLTVTALTRYLKDKFAKDENLQLVYLKGEISNFKAHTSGHYYFSLKDETSKINAIVFNSNAKKISFIPKEGMKILVIGRISIYEATGNYQIYIDEMIEDGLGNLYINFEKLKEQLNKEGLFDEKHKKEIPKFPKKIGIISSKTGAAIKDILTTIKRRYPICETILFPSLVQGENAKDDLVANIKKAQLYNLDTIIIGRGGGSIEDLWPFNEEIVARAIFDSNIPIISAVGHEIDYTICDFVSDFRAPTPTAAAEIAVPNLNDVINYLKQLSIRNNEAIFKKINYNKLLLESFNNSYVIKNPTIMFENKKQLIDKLNEKINTTIKYNLDKTNNDFLNKIEKLKLLNPLNIIERGYTITYYNNNIIDNVKCINVNDEIKTITKKGIIISKVIKLEE